nr:hypothetical protein [Polymorphobacter multimanifer]
MVGIAHRLRHFGDRLAIADQRQRPVDPQLVQESHGGHAEGAAEIPLQLRRRHAHQRRQPLQIECSRRPRLQLRHRPRQPRIHRLPRFRCRQPPRTRRNADNAAILAAQRMPRKQQPGRRPAPGRGQIEPVGQRLAARQHLRIERLVARGHQRRKERRCPRAEECRGIPHPAQPRHRRIGRDIAQPGILDEERTIIEPFEQAGGKGDRGMHCADIGTGHARRQQD